MAGNQPVEYVIWLGLRKDKDVMSKEDFTTSELETVNMASCGILRKKDGATTTVTPLLTTTTSSARIPKSRIQFGPNPKDLLEGFQSTGEKLNLAVRINGPAKTVFPEGKPKKTPAEGETPPPEEPAGESLKESKGPINVIVVADADMLEDRYWTRVQNFFGQRVPVQTADNATFAINAIDNLAGSNDLISLRSRGRSIRPFDKVIELRREAESKFHQKEKDLEAKLREAEQKINELQGNKDTKSPLILSAEQQAEIEKFRDEKLKTRTELRRVKHDLQEDIGKLKTKLLLGNSFGVPILVLGAAIIVWAMRRKRLMQARESAGRS
jgi:ABC-type uncharacterized transport system involved in gliding motility auxiliary subunit